MIAVCIRVHLYRLVLAVCVLILCVFLAMCAFLYINL